MSTLSEQQEQQLKAQVFDRLLEHLDNRKDAQNIDLMILAGFCRNCLSKWYQQAAADIDINIDSNQAREKIYGMPYSEWKDKYQLEATEAQLAALKKASNPHN
ncbi:DUF1244 domain-containing protein [Marinicella sp. W31]|uniref:DUF1244 domain-containing protein n=1 Tax=Marinicella sp. W31 TaxID=3023713 RepID=UPI003757A108